MESVNHQLITQLKTKKIDFDRVASESIAEWFDVISKANDTTPMMLLAAAMPSVAVLMGF